MSSRRPSLVAILPHALRAAAAAIALAASSAHASILSMNRVEIDFTSVADASAKADWADLVSVGPEGLGWDADPTSVREGWIQTKPIATGLWWRPATSISLRVEISPAPAPITLANGQTHVPWGGLVYARYSADRQHWSDWQALEWKAEKSPAPAEPVAAEKTPAPPLSFAGTLAVPQLVREPYVKYLESYARMDVPWTSDEEALCRWIITQDRDFFARTIPFVGYVELLFEHGFHGNRRIRSLRVDLSFGMSGMSAIPRDPAAARLNDQSPWRFVGEPKKK